MDIKNKTKQLKKWIWKISFFVTLIFCQVLNAGEVFRFTKITCIPELNYFDASVVEIDSGSDEEFEFMNNNQKELKTKYQLIGEQISDVQECKLKDSNIKIQIKYRSADRDGLCGRAPSVILKLWFNDKLAVDLDGFNDICKNEKGIVRIVFNTKHGEPTLYFEMNDYMDAKSSCIIKLDKKKQNIESNSCRESGKSLPIKDDYIIETRPCSSCTNR